MRQPSLMGFVSKKSAIDKVAKSLSAMRSTQRMLTENGQSATSTPTATFGATTTTSKFKFNVPVKRKSESLIEISDDSRSPTKFENIEPASKRTHMIDSDCSPVTEKGASSFKSAEIKALYAKYDSPKKQEPVKSSAIQLTPEDKLNLDKALRSNDAYAKAQKKLDENLHSLTAKAGSGKFKFNKPRASLNATNDGGGESNSLLPAASEVQPLSIPNGSLRSNPVATATSTSVQSTIRPLSTSAVSSKPKPVATVPSSSVRAMASVNIVSNASIVKDTPPSSYQSSTNTTMRSVLII